MQALISYESEVTIVRLSGRVDVETAVPFREACLKRLVNQPVVFDFQGLSFVGSSGILPFLEAMQLFANANSRGYKFSSVGSEFRKVFAATPLHVIEIHETPEHAVRAFLNPPNRGNENAPAAVQAVPLNQDAVTAAAAQAALGPVPAAPFGFISFRDEPADSVIDETVIGEGVESQSSSGNND
jgi:anti-anti-sigma factor